MREPTVAMGIDNDTGAAPTAPPQQLMERLKDYGQEHVFSLCDELSPQERHLLLNDIQIDHSLLAAIPWTAGGSNRVGSGELRVIGGGENDGGAGKMGLKAISEGKLAVLLLSGGQGTRLGSSDPKGCFNEYLFHITDMILKILCYIQVSLDDDIELPSVKSLFKLQAERILCIQRLATQAMNEGSAGLVAIHCYIMTSPFTDDATRKFFEGYFLPARHHTLYLKEWSIYNGHFIQVAYCFNCGGHMSAFFLSQVAKSPDGNGGVYSVMKSSRLLEDMASRGIKYVDCYGVDNILVRVADPTFLGYFIDKGVATAAKVARKSSASIPALLPQPFVILPTNSVSAVHYRPFNCEILSTHHPSQRSSPIAAPFAAPSSSQHHPLCSSITLFRCSHRHTTLVAPSVQRCPLHSGNPSRFVVWYLFCYSLVPVPLLLCSLLVCDISQALNSSTVMAYPSSSNLPSEAETSIVQSSPSDLVSLSIICHRLNSENYIVWSQSHEFHALHEIWNTVKETYSNQENSSALFSIECRINDLKQGDLTVTQYFTQLSRLWKQIDLFEFPDWKIGADAKLYKGLLEKRRIFQFLSGLSVSLDVCSRILGTKPLLSLREVFSEGRCEEIRRSLLLPLIVESFALNTHSSGDTRVKKGHPWCDHYRKPGHVRDKCWKLHGRPASWTPSKSSSHPSHCNSVVTTVESGSFSSQQLDYLRQMFGHLQIPHAIESKSACTVSEGSSHFTFLSPSPGCVSWIVDSEASDHMTGNFTLFSTFQKKCLTCNLRSISKLSTDLGCTSYFTRDYCEFQDLTSGMVIDNARHCGGLYILDTPPYTLVPNHSPALFISSFVSVSPLNATADIVL
ncbi:UDP-N-acetylglucosamine diphosphorylase 2 [Hibiscus syriacus]|uniref:UDP-N-acetylglucosamine diphosphorylase n=1 Tax=Hibiscus syriacus TaxID=106335 RepID=A0A6A3AUP1_HIBSY|nr:UDP-N-acetylglucosamine diphosphorylase 2 [Hibiscus syriacus]